MDLCCIRYPIQVWKSELGYFCLAFYWAIGAIYTWHGVMGLLMFVLTETVVLWKHYLVQVQQSHPTWSNSFTFWLQQGWIKWFPSSPPFACSFLLLVPKGTCHVSAGFTVCLRCFQAGWEMILLEKRPLNLTIVDRSRERSNIWVIARADDSVRMSILQNLERLLCQCSFWRNVVGQYHLSRICKVLHWFSKVSIVKVLFSSICIFLKTYLLVFAMLYAYLFISVHYD